MSFTTEMLRRVSNKEVHGPDFSVLVPSIHQVLYRQGERVAVVEIEGGVDANGKVNWLLYQETLRSWDPPHSHHEMSANQREEILSAIRKSMDLLDMPHECM